MDWPFGSEVKTAHSIFDGRAIVQIVNRNRTFPRVGQIDVREGRPPAQMEFFSRRSLAFDLLPRPQ